MFYSAEEEDCRLQCSGTVKGAKQGVRHRMPASAMQRMPFPLRIKVNLLFFTAFGTIFYFALSAASFVGSIQSKSGHAAIDWTGIVIGLIAGFAGCSTGSVTVLAYLTSHVPRGIRTQPRSPKVAQVT
jgi:hypothetical protein